MWCRRTRREALSMLRGLAGAHDVAPKSTAYQTIDLRSAAAEDCDSRASSGTGALSSCWCRRLLALAGPSIWQRCARGSPAELVALTPEKGALHGVFGALDRRLVGNQGRLDATQAAEQSAERNASR